jgi:hypothetical protein
MILIACTDFALGYVQPHLLQIKLAKEGIKSSTFIFKINSNYEIIFTPLLKDLIQKADLILLFIQPYPAFDWIDPQYSFYITILSFVNLHKTTKNKTFFIAPFLPTGPYVNFDGTKLLNDIILKSKKLNQFEIFPRDPDDFLNPPHLRVDLPEKIDPTVCSQFYSSITSFCMTRVKKSSRAIESNNSIRSSPED